MRADILIECINVLNNADIDNPADQKAISVCENYIMHSYDLYLENCTEMGYPALSQQDYMLEILSLDEGFFKKLVKGAAITAAAGAAAYGGAKVVRANQGFRAANGISSGPNASFGQKIKSNLSSMGQMVKQSAGTGNSIIDKAKGVGANIMKGTKVFGKNAKDANTQKWQNVNVNRTVDSNGKQQVTMRNGQEAGTGVTNTTTKLNQDGTTKQEKTVNSTQNAAATMSANQQHVKQANQNLAEKQKKAQQAEQEVQDAKQQVDQATKENAQPTNESYSPFIASNLKEPLTPAIRVHKSII